MKLFLLFAVVLVLAVVHVNGVRRCIILRCRSRSGRPVGCPNKHVKGNINSIKVLRRRSSAKCRPGRDYVLHSRNKKVILIRGKCNAFFKVCFTLASDPYECYYYKSYQRKLIRRKKTTYKAMCKINSGIYRTRLLPYRKGCGSCSCCKRRGGRVRHCIYLRCGSRSGRPVRCHRRRIKGNIYSINVVRRYSRVTCRKGMHYKVSRLNRRVILIRGKCIAKFKVCFSVA